MVLLCCDISIWYISVFRLEWYSKKFCSKACLICVQLFLITQRKFVGNSSKMCFMSMCKELLSRKIHQKLFDLDLYVNIVQSYKLLNYDSTTPSYLKCDSSATLELFKYSLLINHFFCFLDLLVRIQSSKFHIKVMSTFSVSINQTFMSNHIMIHQK